MGLLEGERNEIEKGINEGRIHIDDVILFLEGHAMGDFEGVLYGVGKTGEVGNIGAVLVGEGIVIVWVRLTAVVVSVERGVNCNVQKVHLL